MADRPQPHQGAHPTPLTYLKVAMILVILTGIEVGVFYIDALESAFLPIFLLLSVAKFCLVILFYMHLKFDSRLFSGVFIAGLLLAVAVVVVLMSLFQVVSAVANPRDDGAAAVASDGEPKADSTVHEEGPPTLPETDQPEDASPSEEYTEPAETEAEQPEALAPDSLVSIGQEIFMNAPDNVGPQALWCSTCHQIQGVAPGMIGPDVTHIATDAVTRKSGMSAEQYIKESIKTPEVFVAAGVDRATPGLMTGAITSGLTDEQVDALVAFLMTLE